MPEHSITAGVMYHGALRGYDPWASGSERNVRIDRVLSVAGHRVVETEAVRAGAEPDLELW